MRIVSANWKRQLNITKYNTYNFPPYIPIFHRFPYRSSPTILPRPSTPLPIFQFQQYMSLHHHCLPLIHHHSLHQHSPPLIHHMFYLRYRYWPPTNPSPPRFSQTMNPSYSDFYQGKHHRSSATWASSLFVGFELFYLSLVY